MTKGSENAPLCAFCESDIATAPKLHTARSGAPLMMRITPNFGCVNSQIDVMQPIRSSKSEVLSGNSIVLSRDMRLHDARKSLWAWCFYSRQSTCCFASQPTWAYDWVANDKKTTTSIRVVWPMQSGGKRYQGSTCTSVPKQNLYILSDQQGDVGMNRVLVGGTTVVKQFSAQDP